LPTC
jgi:MFS family permease